MRDLIGPPRSRTDGKLKTMGLARYTADIAVPNVTHGVTILSTVASGRIKAIDTSRARAATGVIAIITHENAPPLKQPTPNPLDDHRPAGMAHLPVPLQDNLIRFDGQLIGVVIAETLEQAEFAASLVRIEYETAPAKTRLADYLGDAVTITKPLGGPPEVKIGDAEDALKTAALVIDETYSMPFEHHHPMELSATTALWDGDRLTIYDASQFVFGVRETMREIFDLPATKVRAITNFVGGGFGCKRAMWPHIAVTALAARMVNRPVRVMLTRAQMFTSVGYRSPNIQRMAFGAGKDGKLVAIIHDNVAQSPVDDELVEPLHRHTQTAYAAPNIHVRNRVVHLNVPKPTVTRSPGNSSGSFALESAMDELACRLGVDPIELRLRNSAEAHPMTGKPWSSKALTACLEQGAERFGWTERAKMPGQIKKGHLQIGCGMAAATYPVASLPAAARVLIRADGTALVQTASHEIGNGAYTILGQIAAETLGLSPDRVEVQLGDTQFPAAPPSAAAATTTSVGPAVARAAKAALARLAEKSGIDPASPLFGVDKDKLISTDGYLAASGAPDRRDRFQDILAREGLALIEGSASIPAANTVSPFAKFSFGAQFCEVSVDTDLGLVRVTRMLGVFGAGRIVNVKTARSQMIGGMVWGIGMALHEESLMDHRYGRFATRNLAEYFLLAHADVPALGAVFVEEDDQNLNDLGVKSIGELGNVGVAAAIANAVFNATGRRLRKLPIRIEDLL